MTIDPVSAVLEGVVLGAHELQGTHPWKASAEDIMQACIRLVEDYGIKLEGSGRICRESGFRLGGDDEFVYLKDQDDNGDPVIVIEWVQD